MLDLASHNFPHVFFFLLLLLEVGQVELLSGEAKVFVGAGGGRGGGGGGGGREDIVGVLHSSRLGFMRSLPRLFIHV